MQQQQAGRVAMSRPAAPEEQDGVSQKYEIREVLGVGSSSSCYRCIKRSSKQHYACKVINKQAVNVKYTGLLDQFHVEIEVLRLLRHPNIIHLEDVFENSLKISMVLELMQGGELFDYVVEKGTLEEDEARRMLEQITSAIAYMHKSGVIHRDLKPENLLLTRKGPEGAVKIIDFGLAKMLEMDNSGARTFLGTRGYLAPEMLQRLQYGYEVDVWALGVIAFVLLCGCLPFDDDNSRINRATAQAKFKLRFPKWSSNLSSSARDLLRSLLDVNPLSRTTAEEALEHRWLSGATVKKGNLLESPGALRRLGTPKQSNAYGDPSVQDIRKQDFEEQAGELRGAAQGIPRQQSM